MALEVISEYRCQEALEIEMFWNGRTAAQMDE
jgi:hypothetical protein